MNKRSVIRILKAAHTLLSRPHSWTKRTSHMFNPKTGNHRYCLVGALREVGHKYKRENRKTANDCIREVINRTSLAIWNDEQGRTRKEVLTALQNAIDIARKSL